MSNELKDEYAQYITEAQKHNAKIAYVQDAIEELKEQIQKDIEEKIERFGEDLAKLTDNLK